MKRKLTKADETTDFVEFWDFWKQYARDTDGRGLARDAFFKHVWAGADPRDIIDAAHFFILRKLKDKNFIPLVASWLNSGSYEDLADEERKYQARLQERSKPQQNVVQMVVLPRNHFLNQNRA